ncbi:MAG TPA: ribonuclease Y [bacterium]|nr:ribonuclease Y [bacterium]
MKVFVWILVSAVACFAIGLILGMWLRSKQESTRVHSATEKAESIIREATAKAEALSKDALIAGERQAQTLRKELEADERARRQALQEEEARLREREGLLLTREGQLSARDRELEQRERALAQAEATLADATRVQQQELERVGQMSRNEAQGILLRRLDEELKGEYGKKIRLYEEQLKEEADHKARRLLSLAIQRCAMDHTAETTISVVHLPSDDMKGRIIGREGRNIRSFETLTGCDVIIDDTPDAVVISAFDPVRREIARVALQALVDDGRIHPGRIEEEYEKARIDIDNAMLEAAKDAVAQTGIGEVAPELLKIFGRLKYRYSYGQPVLKHSIEVAFLCANMAMELGTNVMLAKRAGLFHDLGKAVDHDVEGTHAFIGGELAQRFGEHPVVVHAIAAHHAEVEQKYVEAILAQVGDAISGGRPGARGDTLDNYIRRLGRLEAIANSFEGVAKSFAIQAGRELRIMVHPRDLDDGATDVLAREIAKRIEDELDFPGQIKVTVIRELRATATAK